MSAGPGAGWVAEGVEWVALNSLVWVERGRQTGQEGREAGAGGQDGRGAGGQGTH